MEITTRSSVELIAKLPEGEKFVSMVVFKKKVVIASTKGAYWLVDDKLMPIYFDHQKAVID